LTRRTVSGRIGKRARNNAVPTAIEHTLPDREISFSTLARIAPVGILWFDANGRCNYANERWCQITGLTIDDALGEGWLTPIHIEDRAEVLHRWTAMREMHDRFAEEYRVCHTDGSVRWVFAEGAALRGDAGEALGFVRVVTDITRHRQLEAELAAARQDLESRVRERTAELRSEIAERQKLEKGVLEATDREQQRFSRDLHDGLGQHLIGIRFRLSGLQRDLEVSNSRFAKDAEQIVGLITDASEQAHQLARGVHPIPLRPDGLVLALEELTETLCASTKANCTFECEEPVHIEDNAVATHLYRIAQEALTNALKYSSASRIAVRLRSNGETAELVVEDDGIGFDRRSRSRQSGRGLNIMRHRARLIEASVDLRSAPGEGTTVCCKFPLRRSA
jgi:PAS domain S-box-containing protein